MDIKELFSIIKKEKNIVVFCVVFFLAVGLFLFVFVPQLLDASYYFTLKKTPNPSNTSSEALYHIQLGEKTADFLAGWLASQVRSLPESSVINGFSSVMVSYEVVGVKFSAANQQDAKNLYDATNSFVAKKIQQMNSDIFQYQPFSFTASELKLVSRSKDPFGYVAGGILFGLFFGFFVAFVKFYYKK
jgi:hypothetical protein